MYSIGIHEINENETTFWVRVESNFDVFIYKLYPSGIAGEKDVGINAENLRSW